MASHSIPLVYNFDLIEYSIKECCNFKNNKPKILKKLNFICAKGFYLPKLEKLN